MDKENFDWKKYLTECMRSTDYCCIATIDPKGVWSNPVYFAWDDQFNLYFISQIHSRHMHNIQQNECIAVSIYKTEQKGDVVGIQLDGSAKILSDEEDIKPAFDVYYRRAGTGKDVVGYIHNPTWIFVKITATSVYYFDTRFFDEERRVVPMDKIKY